MSKRFVMLDVRHPISFVEKTFNLSRKNAVDFVFYMVLENINSRLNCHVSNVTDYSVHYASILFNTSIDNCDAAKIESTKKMMRDTSHILTIQQDISNQIDPYVEYNTWVIWSVFKSGDVIVIAEQEDYRITEYDRIHNVNNGNAYAVISMNIDNPINFIKNQVFSILGITHSNVREYVAENLKAFIIEALLKRYPNIEKSKLVPSPCSAFADKLGIQNFEEFQDLYITGVVNSLGLSYFTTRIDRNMKYVLEFHNSIISIYQIQEIKDPAEKLALELLRGDYLPERERQIAERYILDNNLG